jgi:nicotinamide riboside kinase
MKQLFCITGASGTGKSTLLKYINQNFNIHVTEVSARPFLPENTDYVNSLDLFSQVLITQNRFVSFVEQAINNNPTVFSRSPIDSLAYERVLNKAPFIEELLMRQIDIINPLIQHIYIPIEFPMEPENDTIRGANVEVQLRTDFYIQRILRGHDVSFITVKGTIEERCRQLDAVLKDYKK